MAATKLRIAQGPRQCQGTGPGATSLLPSGGDGDALLSNSFWYVPQENLLASLTSGTSFTSPTPTAGSDQTHWSVGTATNGVFTGTAIATFRPSSQPLVQITSTNAIGPAIVTDGGQIRMRFTSTSSITPIIGIGQMRTISGTDSMQMQMISGNESVLVTHWACIANHDPNSFVPPTLFPDGTLLSQEWRWTEETTWQLQSDELFGTGGSGTFTITDYRHGYFWRPGTGLTAQMALRPYDGTSFGALGYATVLAVPEPAAVALLAVATATFVLIRRRPR